MSLKVNPEQATEPMPSTPTMEEREARHGLKRRMRRWPHDHLVPGGASPFAGHLRGWLASLVAYAVLFLVYALTLLAAAFGRLVPHRRWRPSGRIAVTGTFHNPGWYLSHVVPLTRSGGEEVILVVDEPQAPLERVRFVCPPRWVATILSRALAKGLWMVITGLRFRPDLYMGYHFLPGACSALIAARLFGRPACYQMTAGPVEVFGGGFHAEHWVTRSLAQPSAFLERLAMAVARQFELVVVRGCKAKTFLAERRLGRKVAVITGCVSPRPETSGHRPLHLAFVGRIEEDKQPIQFVEITAVVRRTVPGVRAVMLGGGPLMDAVRRRADELGVADCIDILGKRDDVAAFLATSKVFVLTSQSEGLSIAMAEAMAAGAVPVVADVGELGDLVENGVNGYLVEPDNIDQYATHISSLLRDPVLWTRCSQAAAAAATRHCGVDAVTALWRRHLDETIQRAAGHPTA